MILDELPKCYPGTVGAITSERVENPGELVDRDL